MLDTRPVWWGKTSNSNYTLAYNHVQAWLQFKGNNASWYPLLPKNLIVRREGGAAGKEEENEQE